MTDRTQDTDWFFDWPSGYVRYRNGRREAWQDSFSKTSQMANEERLRLTAEEREAIAWAVAAAEDCQHPADDTLRGLLERTKEVSGG